ncbi:Paf1 [Rhizoctonia solani]|uniref:Paf1 n=1 Tax=Rhizoctonia solani TaxID=456999 RepID=A0A8H7IBG6_9AGAM|nr:Paf1 [Rhizoctonia solani]
MKDTSTRTRRKLLDKPARGVDNPAEKGTRTSTLNLTNYFIKPNTATETKWNSHSRSRRSFTWHSRRWWPTRPRRDALSKGSDAPSSSRTLTGSAPGRIMPIELLREFIKKRYNPELRFLNLENMAEDELLKSKNILPPTMKMLLVKLVRRCSSWRDNFSPGASQFVALGFITNPFDLAESISFANNSFTNLHSLRMLPTFLPQLKNISFQNNEIRMWKDLEAIIPNEQKHRDAVSSIREIILMGNPVHNTELAKGDLTAYRSEVVRRFPNLDMLDQEPIVKIGFDVPLPEIMERDRALKKTRMYFELFDSNRTLLAPAYSPRATFSLSLNTSIPPRARIRGYHSHLPHQKELTWKAWMDVGSRNLMRVAKLEKTTNFLRSTAEDVIKALTAIPGTRHDVTAAGKFVVDAFTCLGVLPGEGDAGIVLFINVHGEFAEQPTGGLRSFDRVFVVAPSPPDSPSYAAGWRVTILSDQLTVRGYSANEAWVPGPIVVQNVNSGKGTTPVPAPMPSMEMAPMDPILADLSEPQRALMAECAGRTGLNGQYSRMCLEGNGWTWLKRWPTLKSSRSVGSWSIADGACFEGLSLVDHELQERLDLLVKVRYTNPLPAPPCPPKLLNIPTHPNRYVRPEFTATLAAETPLPMVVDSECGMPLDLFGWDGLWDGEWNTKAIELNPTEPIELDEADAELLFEPPSHAHVPAATNGHSLPSTPSVNVQPNVSWLRRAEYASRSMTRQGNGPEMPLEEEVTVDASLPAQIAVIEKSWQALTVASSFELLPDVDIWANPYLQIRFIERPGERPLDMPDPRLDCGILRPQQTEDDEHFISFYLPTEDADAEAFKARRRAPVTAVMNETTDFEFQRDYESAKIENDITNEFLVVIDEGGMNADGTPVISGHAGQSDGVHSVEGVHEGRKSGAYYKAVERKIVLKKKPVIKGQEIDYTDKWDVIKLFHIPIAAEDQEERNELQAEVTDPQWTFGRLDAPGEADEEMAAD